MNNFKKQQGSALLISILIMGVLLVLGISVNELILRQIALQRDLVQGGKAYFLAESAVENALLDLHNNLPGYTEKGKEEILEKDELKYKYEILGQEGTVPCSYQKNQVGLFKSLDLNESLTLPLFKDDGNKGETKIKDFTVDFYVDRMGRYSTFLPQKDVLRWKIIGEKNNKTESISQYLKIQGTKNTKSDFTTFGTKGLSTEAKFYEGQGDTYVYYPRYQIKKFLDDHDHNFLVLTNVVDVLKQVPSAARTREFNKIKFRLKETEKSDEDLVCEYSLIKADGFAGDYKQSLDVKLRLSEFLPVFDFALYRTEK